MGRISSFHSFLLTMLKQLQFWSVIYIIIPHTHRKCCSSCCHLSCFSSPYPSHRQQCRDLRRPALRSSPLSLNRMQRLCSITAHWTSSAALFMFLALIPVCRAYNLFLRTPYALSIVHRVFLCALLNLWRAPSTSPLNGGINQLLQA